MAKEQLSAVAICFHFPPVGGAGSPRAVHSLPQMQDEQIGIAVLTIDADTLHSNIFHRDETHVATVADLKTIRLNASGKRFSLQRKFPSLHKFVWFLAYPAELDYGSAWASRIKRWRRKLPKDITPDVVYVSAPPFSSIAAGRRLANRAGSAFVIDYRDPWTVAPLSPSPSRAHFWWEQWHEKRLLRRADAVILNTPEAMDAYCAWLPELAERCEVVRNAAVMSPTDIEIDGSGSHRTDHTFELAYIGTLYEDRVVRSRLGQYRRYAINETARSLAGLIGALKMTNPETRSAIRVTVAGFVPPQQRKAVKEAELDRCFNFVGTVPHAESTRIASNSNALFLNQVAWVDDGRAMPHVPGKTYEYLNLGKPILCISAAGALRSLLEDTPQALCFGLTDSVGVAAALDELVAGTLRPMPHRQNSLPDPQHLAHEIAEVLRSAVERRREQQSFDGSERASG